MPIHIDVAKTLPVVVSILIILAVAALRNYSRGFASIAAVMPLNIPLGMWIVYAGADDKQATMTEFTGVLLVNIIPTLIFMIIAWQGTKAGWSLGRVLVVGYAAWALALAAVFAVRRVMA
ncbi:hypothetical protein [Aggregatilinea lenta]|uniref:hypothetical protein n=1 Tax=Aggregatilinea lenta TaxID=913108 RepID=UPI000E5B8F06|nr:hypothetical protein [Aggregatilinea lenta]